MRTVLAALFLLFACSITQAAIEDTNPGIMAGEAIMELPEDGNAFFCTVFTSAQPDANEQKLLSWFSTDPQLAALAKQTHFANIRSNASTFKTYWEGTVDAHGVTHPPLIRSLPAVVVQRPLPGDKNQIVARFQAPSPFFKNSKTLASAIAACIRAETLEVGGPNKRHIFARPWRPDCDTCPQPKPYEPDIAPLTPKPLVPDITPDEEEEEVVREEVAEEEDSFLVILLAIGLPLGLVAIVGGLVTGWATFKPKHKFYKHR